MKRFLLDVNAALALLDPMHVHHEAAHQWYVEESPMRLLFCAHVINGVMRIASQPRYPNHFESTALVREVLKRFIDRAGAHFCSAEASLLDDQVVGQPELLSPSSVADLHLLATAIANDAKLATFDRQIPAEAIVGGPGALELIPESGGSW